MRSCGGSGKHYDIPPTDYLPRGLAEENRCLKCDMVCENETSLKAHLHMPKANKAIRKVLSKASHSYKLSLIHI